MSSFESYKDAAASAARAADAVDPILTRRMKLSDLDYKIYYVPVIMPDFMLRKYTSQFIVQDKKVVHGPQLIYRLFGNTSKSDPVFEYLRGFSTISNHLSQMKGYESLCHFVNLMVADIEMELKHIRSFEY